MAATTGKLTRLDDGEGVLQFGDLVAQRVGCAGGFLLEQRRNGAEGGEIHAAGEMLAFAGDDGAAYRLVAFEHFQQARQFGPEIRRHAVSLVGPVQRNLGDRTVARYQEET